MKEAFKAPCGEDSVSGALALIGSSPMSLATPLTRLLTPSATSHYPEV